MQLELLFFAHAARVSGQERQRIELPEGSTVGDAVAQIFTRHPQLAELEGALQFAVDEELAKPERILHDGETLAILPPFSGG